MEPTKTSGGPPSPTRPLEALDNELACVTLWCVDYRAAKTLLSDHAGGSNQTGFISCLRPYTGLRDSNFHEVMHALLVVMQEHPREGPLDREIADSAWAICHTARICGTDPNAMLRRNDLITKKDLERLREWIHVIEHVVGGFISGVSVGIAVSKYAAYIVRHGLEHAPTVLVTILAEQLDHGDLWDVETTSTALALFGTKARSALPALRRAAARRYTNVELGERKTAKLHATVQAAIHRISG